jgi:hypothetical protein
MKKILFTLLACCSLLASAQQVTVVEQTRLLKDVEGPAYYPVLNSTGDKLLFTSADCTGLEVYDFNDNVVSRISNERGAGIDARFSADGKVYYITQSQGKDMLIYRTGRDYDLATGKSSVVLEAQHGALLPEVGSKGVAMKGAKKSFASAKNLGTAVYTQGSTVNVTVNGVTRSFSPVKSYAGYLWSSVSPSGDKVAFFAAGKGIVVIDLNGKVLAMLGKYEMPAWYDNDYIVAQNAKDDGHQITSSQILLLKADGTFKKELTDATSMSMQPTAAAGKIVYTSIDGNLYEMKISINQ